jgi:4-hydroxy-4-methyl-2-oxoglutarate aldolase
MGLGEMHGQLQLSTATAHEAAGRIGALPARIKPVRTGMLLWGSAYPVSGVAGDNLWLHRALLSANPGDILVAAVVGESSDDHGYWGEVLAVAAQAKGIAGLVIDGGVRDAVRLAERGFPVFSTCVAIRGTNKDPSAPLSLGTPVQLGDVRVHAGDLVIGDDDGVVVLPRDGAADAVAAGAQRDEEERLIFERLHAGESTLAVYGLPERSVG